MSIRKRLNPRQIAFARLYAAGPPAIRGNGVAAYRAAGFKPKNDRVAEACASRLLSKAIIQEEIGRLYRAADAETIAQLRDWRLLAPPAQSRIQSISLGYLPDPTSPANVIPITKDDAAVARVVLEASRFIIERAYPSKLYADITVQDPADTLARLLGVTPDMIPLPEPEEV